MDRSASILAQPAALPVVAAAPGRLEVRPDAFYVRDGDGVQVSNRTGSFHVAGGGAYDLVGALFDALEEPQQVSELCDGLPAAAAASVERLATLMLDRGVLRLRLDSDDDVMPEPLRERFAVPIRFLAQDGDYPGRRFLSARATPVTCVGSGTVVAAVARALAEFGFADVRLVVDDRPSPTDRPEAGGVRAIMAEVLARDPGANWTLGLTAGSGDRPPQGRAGHLVLATESRSELALQEWCEQLTTDGVTVHVLAPLRGLIVAMPFAGGDADGRHGCWRCLGLSFVGHASSGQGAWRSSPVPLTVAATYLVQEVFRHAAGGRTPHRVLTVDPGAPVVRSHRLARHPRCRMHTAPPRPARPRAAPTGDLVRSDVASAEHDEDLTTEQDRVVAATARWTDPLLGPLISVGEGDDEQIPLASSTCRVVDPLAGDDALIRTMRCLAIAPREARNQAVLLALEWVARRTLVATGRASDLVVAAGWSYAEASWRAWLRALSGAGAGAGPLQDAGTELDVPVNRYLLDALRAEQAVVSAVRVAPADHGTYRAQVRCAGVEHTVTGCGAEHAVGTALLQALAACLPHHGVPAALAPPTATWTRARAGLDVPATEVDLTDLLPYAGFDLALVGVPPLGGKRR